MKKILIFGDCFADPPSNYDRKFQQYTAWY